MTALEKTQIARFLDMAEDCLRDGYAKPREEYAFAPDAEPEAPEPSGGPEFSSLPLAYQVAEEEGFSGEDSLDRIAAEIRTCTSCALAEKRTLAVPGEGSLSPLVLVIGEGPGADEDASGRPFVGKAGQLLDRMLASIGLFREKNCFIANGVKCRPPGNRDPQPEELSACASFLQRQIRLLGPLVILCAGRVAAQSLLQTAEGIGKLRGRFTEYQGIPLLPTYHPSALLREESLKKPAFEDLKLLMIKLAALDKGYCGEALPLMKKYASQDEAFAAAAGEFLS